MPGIYSEALRRQGRLESLTTLFERFARNGCERLPVLSRVTQKSTESVAMQLIVPLIFMVSGAIIESNVES